MIRSPVDHWTHSREYAVPHVRIRQVAKIVRSLDPATVLDLGCHDGQLARLLPGMNYTGCDFVAPDKADFPFALVDLNAGGLPATLPPSDVVVASGVLEYVVNLPELLSDIRTHVAPGGAAVATYFNMNHLSRVVGLGTGRSFPVHPDWRNFYSRREFEHILRNAGFVIERVFVSTSSPRTSPSVHETQDIPAILRPARSWSDWLAHQFIYIARPI